MQNFHRFPEVKMIKSPEKKKSIKLKLTLKLKVNIIGTVRHFIDLVISPSTVNTNISGCGI